MRTPNFPGRIDFRFGGDGGAQGNNVLAGGPGVGGLVDFQAHAVAEAVAEVFPVSASSITLRAAASTLLAGHARLLGGDAASWASSTTA